MISKLKALIKKMIDKMAESRISRILREIHDTSDDPQVISCTEAAIKRREEEKQ